MPYEIQAKPIFRAADLRILAREAHANPFSEGGGNNLRNGLTGGDALVFENRAT
jgi:hypothetical protein